MTVADTSALDFVEWENELAIVDETLGTLGVPESSPPLSFYESTPVPTPAAISWVPIPDNPTTYTGPGTQPSWEDVFNWYATTTHAQTPDLQTAVAPAGPQVQNAIDVAAGQTIKALSGFINQAVNVEKFDSAILANRITDVEKVIGALQADNVTDITTLKNEMTLVVNVAIPELWKQLQLVDASIVKHAQDVIKIMQVWTTENIFNPLNAKLTVLDAKVAAQPASILSQVPDIVKSVVPTLGLASAAALAGVATRVATLEAEDAACTQPMCQTMGPNTNLGKLLKALNLAADAAIIAELLGMNEHDLVALIQSLVAHMATLVTDFEGFFNSGTETIGGLFTNAGL